MRDGDIIRAAVRGQLVSSVCPNGGGIVFVSLTGSITCVARRAGAIVLRLAGWLAGVLVLMAPCMLQTHTHTHEFHAALWIKAFCKLVNRE